MRNPKRMDGVLEAFKKLWQEFPDWRFMQLICNLQRLQGSDMFYMEDDKFVKFLNEVADGEVWKH